MFWLGSLGDKVSAMPSSESISNEDRGGRSKLVLQLINNQFPLPQFFDKITRLGPWMNMYCTTFTNTVSISRRYSYPKFHFLNPRHIRRIYGEEKAKVIAAVWGTELIQFLAALQIESQDDFKKNSQRNIFKALNLYIMMVLLMNLQSKMSLNKFFWESLSLNWRKIL